MRPPNLPTAAADIIAGCAIVGVFAHLTLNFTGGLAVDMMLLVLSSILLYAGGVVLNDVFDFEIDKAERPERPIPMGTVPINSAIFLGSGLLVLGVLLSFVVQLESGIVAIILTATILVYDSLAKHHVFFGPLVMGSCRGLNLMLGMTIFGIPPVLFWCYSLLPIIYIAAVTLISRGEVHGNNKKYLLFSGLLYGVVIISILTLILESEQHWLLISPFLILFIGAIFKPLVKAYSFNTPENIKKAVKAGVISLVLMNAALAASTSEWWVGLLIILLLPLSLFLSKRFSVT